MKRSHKRKPRAVRFDFRHVAGDVGMTHQQIADELGITAARVGQIEEKALEKLRRALAHLDIREAT